MKHSVLLSRILSALGALASAGALLWFVSTSLAPVEAPMAPIVARGSVKFDPKADVSKHSVFTTLRPPSVTSTAPAVTGRENPFFPPSKEAAAPESAPIVPFLMPSPVESSTTTAPTTTEFQIMIR